VTIGERSLGRQKGDEDIKRRESEGRPTDRPDTLKAVKDGHVFELLRLPKMRARLTSFHDSLTWTRLAL